MDLISPENGITYHLDDFYGLQIYDHGQRLSAGAYYRAVDQLLRFLKADYIGLWDDDDL
jgi:hypothetical protein